MTARALGIGVTFCAALALGGCGDDQVDALEDDPVASTIPAGGELVSSREEKARDGGLLGKPSPAKVLRIYAFDSEAAAQQGMGELLDEAEDVGWEVSSVAPDDSGFSATPGWREGRPRSTSPSAPTPFAPAPGVFVSLRSRDD